ncbi:hypothetical protein NDU88_002560 [Pleurodeles waltl]|uniref:Uncharacterized protein n=1 Tax=Pleurodeles waltl TaxID=8319 RepID=A0AAV7PC02_PLEWA|nr:hypothetical protein NDU88_002560 [Pleurodeles waltl]
MAPSSLGGGSSPLDWRRSSVRLPDAPERNEREAPLLTGDDPQLDSPMHRKGTKGKGPLLLWERWGPQFFSRRPPVHRSQSLPSPPRLAPRARRLVRPHF